MKLLHGFTEPASYRGGFVSIGNFDGVHRGHQRMLAMLVAHARRDGAPAVVFTFDPHPIKLLRPGHAPPSLSTLERKAELLERCGVDCVIAYPTNQRLLDLKPAEFFEQIIRGELDARGLVEGPNFFFGHDRTGDIRTLEQFCRVAGLILDIAAPVQIGDQLVSSSAVRAAISRGDIATAVEMLGHPYQIHGRVTSGAGRGATLGYPTANLTDVETLLPPEGVYAGVGRIAGREYPAAINIGANPTFGDAASKLEVHLVGFTGDLYGADLKVDFLDRLRDTRPFAGADELREQLRRDITRVREITKG
jgi:riboflavin kinase/FMN adenylyltransferase